MFEGRRGLCLSVVRSFVVGAVVASKGKKLSIKLVVRHDWRCVVGCWVVQERGILVERGSSIEGAFENGRRMEMEEPALRSRKTYNRRGWGQ